MEIRPYQETDELSVVQLWRDCGLVVQWNNPNLDIERKLNVQREMFLVGIIDGTTVATVMAGYEGHPYTLLGSKFALAFRQVNFSFSRGM